MSTSTISALTAASTIDPVQDYLAIDTASLTATQKINRNTLLGLSSQPVGLTDSQTLTNKTLTSPTISGPTFSGTLAGTYTIGGTPTFPSSVTQNTATQTLTNKTLTSPTINSPSITNATITADTVSGYTTSNTGTIYGMSVSSGVLASAALVGAVNTAAIASNAVISGKLGLSSGYSGGVASQANAGSAGGTMYYINMGGLKMLWIITTASTASTTYSVTFPTSFFATVQGITVGSAGSSGTTTGLYIVTGTVIATGFQYYSGTNPQAGTSFIVMGT
jgi:hypothetical protein